jgi:hypothetical protein
MIKLIPILVLALLLGLIISHTSDHMKRKIQDEKIRSTTNNGSTIPFSNNTDHIPVHN